MTLPDGTVIPRQERKCDVEFGQTTKWDGDQLIVISAFWDAKLQRQQIGQFCAARSITPTRTAWLHIGGSCAASNVTLGVSGGRSAWPEYGQAEMYRLADDLSGSSGNVGRNNVGGVPRYPARR